MLNNSQYVCNTLDQRFLLSFATSISENVRNYRLCILERVNGGHTKNCESEKLVVLSNIIT